MKDICKMLGIEKLNTTASHPQCNGVVERFNRTQKAMLRKQAAKFGVQWDQYLSGVLWAYCNNPHSSTSEKPSFLLFSFDCHSPMEAALIPTKSLKPTNIHDYWYQVMLSLSSARKLRNKPTGMLRGLINTNMTRWLGMQSLKLGNGCSSTLLKMKLVSTENCHSHGMDHTESYHEETQTLLLLKFIFQMMQMYRYISPESNTVLPHSQQDFIGMGTKGQNQEGFLNMFLNN